MFFKKAGDSIYVVGLTKNELGGSEFFRQLARKQGTPGSYGGNVPQLDIQHALAIYRSMNEATSRELLHSSHTPTLGGLAVGFALPCIGGDLGAEINLSLLACEGALDDDARLFSESNSRFVVTCAAKDESEVETVFRDLPCVRVGTVLAEKRLRITGAKGLSLVDADVNALRRAFKEALYGI